MLYFQDTVEYPKSCVHKMVHTSHVWLQGEFIIHILQYLLHKRGHATLFPFTSSGPRLSNPLFIKSEILC